MLNCIVGHDDTSTIYGKFFLSTGISDKLLKLDILPRLSIDKVIVTI